MSNRVYFKGYYGHKNIGDDIFCVTADWICNNIWNNVESIFVGESLPILSKNSICYQSGNPRIRRLFEVIGFIRVKHIIFFGGSTMASIKRSKKILNNVPFLRKKLGTIGTSIGPFKNSNELAFTKKFMKKFNFILVRDYYSLNCVKNDMNINIVSFSFDPAIIIKSVYPSLKTKKTVKRIGISLCHYERYVNGDINCEKERENSLITFIDSLIENYSENYEFVFFEFNGNDKTGDREIIEKFHKRIKDKVYTKIVYYTEDTEKFLLEFNKCQFIIGTRLHSGILAYALEIPFLLVEYHQKCTDFLNTINYKYRYNLKKPKENMIIVNSINKNELTAEKFEKDFMNQIKSLRI